MPFNPAAIAASSKTDSDKIIKVMSGSVAVPSVSGVPVVVNLDTALPFTYFKGRYSVDGGATWADFFSFKVDPVDVINSLQDRLDVLGYFITNPPTEPAGTFQILISNFNSSSYTLLYEVMFIAKPGLGVIDTEPTDYGSAYQSGFNYPKIAFDYSVPITIPGGVRQSTTFNHNLGRIPFILPFINSGNRYSLATDTIDAYSEVTIDTNDVIWTISNEGNFFDASYTLDLRIYHD